MCAKNTVCDILYKNQNAVTSFQMSPEFLKKRMNHKKKVIIMALQLYRSLTSVLALAFFLLCIYYPNFFSEYRN